MTKKLDTWSFGNLVISDGGRITYLSTNYNYYKIPILLLKPNSWMQKYYTLTFTVEVGGTSTKYCDVLIDRNINRVVYPPKDPVLVSNKYRFMGWNVAVGTELEGIEEGDDYVVCEGEPDQVICGDAEDPVICLRPDGGLAYKNTVDAFIYEVKGKNCTVRFNYFTYGSPTPTPTSTEIEIKQNTKIPVFHIHRAVPIDAKHEYEYVFRYWKKVSGNISSSLTIISDLVVFDAVYDKRKKDIAGGSERKETPTINAAPTLPDASEFESCDHWSDSPNHEGHKYCKLFGLDPRNEGEDDFSELKCPFVQYYRSRIGSLTPSDMYVKDATFSQLAMMTINDIHLLLKALFKVNLHIALNERFEKIAVPSRSDWWYGYKEADKWISFEPTVEWKFSNFHAVNQVAPNGKLFCTISNSYSPPTITPVNRELLESGD